MPPPHDRVPFLLGQLGNAVVRALKLRLTPYHLHPRQSVILRTISTSGGVSSRALSEQLSLHRSAMVPLIDDLEARGLITRDRSADDRRVHNLQITELGNELEKSARAASYEFEKEFLSVLEPEEIYQLRDLLQRLAKQHGVSP